MDLINAWRVQMKVDSGTLVQSFATFTDDNGSSTFTEGAREEESNGTTWVDVVETPASGVRRVGWIEIANTDSVTRVISVRYFNGSAGRAEHSWSVPAGKSIFWTPSLGWQVPSTATQVGAEAWETNIIAALGAVQCNPDLAMLQMQRAGNVACTPTNISTSVARCALFRPPQDITVDTIRFYGTGATTNVYRCAIYRYSDGARLMSETAFSTSAATWGTVISGLNLSLTAGELYVMACSVNATGTTAGIGCVGGTVAATTGQIATAPPSLPGKLEPSLGYVSNYFFQVAVTLGALPDPLPTKAAQAAWTGGMPLFFLEAP